MVAVATLVIVLQVKVVMLVVAFLYSGGDSVIMDVMVVAVAAHPLPVVVADSIQ